MAVFALLGLAPMLAYTLVQTARDVRARNWMMAAWGAVMSALLIWLVARTWINPGY